MAQQQARTLDRRSQAVNGDLDDLPAWARTYGFPASSGGQVALARGIQRASDDRVFNAAGGGVFGASPLIESERQAARMGGGTRDLYPA